MNVLLISQCSKNALTETRRILDQFAERRGDRTWQTAITQDGLSTLRKLLRKTARKNTAVACHWIRGKDHSELMWIVGDARQFNSEGAVPTNATERDVLRHGNENDWHTGEVIKLLAQLAALLHDLGKASVAFQQRLRASMRGQTIEKNLYRHEWVSLRLFQAFVGEDDDSGWLERLADESAQHDALWTAPERYLCDGLGVAGKDRYPFSTLAAQAPLAAAIGWLVVTHHRLPVKPVRDSGTGEQKYLGRRSRDVYIQQLPGMLSQVSHDWNELDAKAEPQKTRPYWDMADDLPVVSTAWKKQAARVARRLLELNRQRQENWLDNPYVMHLSRLCLMLADHHYSSLGLNKQGEPVSARLPFLQPNHELVANTTKNQYDKRVLNQSLLEHLLGVAQGAASIAHGLPGFERYLPRLANHRGLRKRTGNPRFGWQDKAFDAAMSLREASTEQGAFIINMASTGCGKTLANARILYALSHPQQGIRATYALGLRTLTLQTGRSYRNDLHLDEDELAILVGGSASRSLFEFYEAQAESTGSASTQNLIEEDSHVLYEGNTADHPLLARALANQDIAKLLSAPMLVCTVDHLVLATESQRAGRQIAPMLRLMSSDLILDELDDYGLSDLPALTRLVYWAGLLGSRIILSSATLPPALVEGMFMAYREGRRHYLKNRGIQGGQETLPNIPCLWVDEFGIRTASVTEDERFKEQHHQFVDSRVAKLIKGKPLRRAEILPLAIDSRQRDQVHADYARTLLDACLRLHRAHAETDPHSGKQVSFGIVRMANIEPLIQVALALYDMGAPPDTHIHLCVYHSRFPLVQRSAIENLLDRAFNRRDENGQGVYQLPEVRSALDNTPAQHQLFVVLASPVCEVGRDWDADWAIAEPSSMRSLIQLAGRVQRHRRKPPTEPNMLLLDAPIKYFLRDSADKAVYTRPGFESDSSMRPFRLKTPWLRDLLRPEEYQTPSAIPRIAPRAQESWHWQESLVDLEQFRMVASMYPPKLPPATARRPQPSVLLEPDQAAPAWQYPQSLLTAVLPQEQPFRDSPDKTTTLAFLPDDDEERLVLRRVEDDKNKRGEEQYVDVEGNHHHTLSLEPADGIGPWKDFDLMQLLQEQAENLDLTLENCAKKMAVVEVHQSEQGWYEHPWLGFWLKK